MRRDDPMGYLVDRCVIWLAVIAVVYLLAHVLAPLVP